MADTLQYVYAIARAGVDVTDVPEGLDDAPVRVECEGAVCALASALPAARYSPDAIETASASVEWMGPRARAHDAVVTWVSDRGPVLPLPMFSMFRDSAALRAMLRSRASELARALERVSRGREYNVRVYVIERELIDGMGELSETVRALEQEASALPPGRRFLTQRKADALRRTEADRVIESVATSVRTRLAEHAIASVEDPVPARQDEEGGGAVLDASFLVAANALEAFRAELTSIAADHEAHGFRFEFTGPWPAYHFAREAASGR